MAKAKTVKLRFPSMGNSRRATHERVYSAPAYPTPYSMNVRLEDSITKRLRGGSFVGATADSITTTQSVYLVTENGDRIVTENGDNIVLGTQYGVATGHDRVFVTPGDDAPASGTADCLYRGRLFRTDGNEILVSRQHDNTDWNYGADLEDTGRAFATQLSEAGEVGADVVAMIPHHDRFLLCFTATSTWIIQGDPTANGTFENVSREVGIIAPRAWCKATTSDDTIYFMSSHGLYSVGANGSSVQPVSEDRVPEDLTGVVDADCVLGYTHADRGVSIHLTVGPSWFYDIERTGFWPFDTSSTDSHLLIGPLRLGIPDNYGTIKQIHGIIAANSGTVAWRIVPGDTSEEAADNGKSAITASLAGNDYDEYVSSYGSWDAGRSPIGWPRATSMWCCIWLSSTEEWAYESINLTIAPFGRWRG